MSATTHRLRLAKVRQIAGRAIFDRLRYHAPEAVISVHPDPEHQGAIILHVNSGGNAQACRHALPRDGFRVEDTDYDGFAPGNYGVQLRVWQPV